MTDKSDEIEFGFPDEDQYRKYTIDYENMTNEEIEKLETIHSTYKKQRTNIFYSSNKKLIEKYCNFKSLINFWSLFSSLDGIVDLSDPDTSLPNSLHALQTAEAIRRDNKPDWFVLCGLIHDMGKVLYLNGNDIDGTSKTTQWALVGDTYITGYPLPPDIVLSHYNALNSDHSMNISIYKDECGLSNCNVSFGHDEYMYRLLQANQHSLPEEALYIVRYHSLYTWHSGNYYDKLMDLKDKWMKSIVKEFNKYDLYTKNDMNIVKWDYKLKDYYTNLVKKYIAPDLMIRC
jgi:inositol oxygenase